MVDAKNLTRAQVGDLLVLRTSSTIVGNPWLITKLPHRMGEKDVFRDVPSRALALVLGRHPEGHLRDYLLVLCDDCIGWLPPDQVGRFLNRRARRRPVQTSGPLG